jgi:hypothetical protein
MLKDASRLREAGRLDVITMGEIAHEFLAGALVKTLTGKLNKASV